MYMTMSYVRGFIGSLVKTENNHMKQLSKILYELNGFSNAIEDEKIVPVVKLSVVGYGDHRKIILSNNDVGYKSKSKPLDNGGTIKPTISLEFAYHCLKNALVIANHHLENKELHANMSSTTSTSIPSWTPPSATLRSTMSMPPGPQRHR